MHLNPQSCVTDNSSLLTVCWKVNVLVDAGDESVVVNVCFWRFLKVKITFLGYQGPKIVLAVQFS